MQKHLYEGVHVDNLAEVIDDPLVFGCPIYDVLDRKYAAFSSFTEALWDTNDPKGNSYLFDHVRGQISKRDLFLLLYLFRFCGSGINYVPSKGLGSHGFGNFWIIKCLILGMTTSKEWFEALKKTSMPFTDSKGYLLPQISYRHLDKGHMKNFILTESASLIDKILNFVETEKREIYQVTDFGNKLLNEYGFKKQNFVLTAFAMDLAEYFPEHVERHSLVYAGTNAQRCIKQIFKRVKKCSDFEYINDALLFLAERYGTHSYSAEDSRACDPIRYFQEYMSKHHVERAGGKLKNNSILKLKMKDYQTWADNLK